MISPIEVYRRLPLSAKKIVYDGFSQYYLQHAVDGMKYTPEKVNKLYRNYIASFGTTQVIFDMELTELCIGYTETVLTLKRWIDKYPESFI